MTIPADVLRRTGYRLPTEAEWEYACRSGTITSRFYGASTELLGLYAHYQANSRERAWLCGDLLPNDLGLFDMLGNEFEWVNDAEDRTRPGRHAIHSDHISIWESISEKNPRLLRGGTFNDPPAFVRAAFRRRSAPSDRTTNFGFRLARTYP
jgi:formylglycine-generating enzyme required for sulfatase activity